MDTSANNKRIAKNTLMLYFRMLLLMLISLYTSRVILDALGVTDYGIYNVVGGFVAMFFLLSGSLSTAISRFITFELGRRDHNRLTAVFSSSVNIQVILVVVLVILGELFGLWFLNCKLVIPTERIYAANWVYQFSVLTMCVQLISVPYNASIVAHEQMKAFAYIGIFEGVGKLCVALCVASSSVDRLILYGLLIAIIQIIVCMTYGLYCIRHFVECKYQFIFDKSLFKEIFSFAGWTFIGSSAIHLRDQGGNLLINLFFGPAVNAARGIALQVNNAVVSFVTNFMMALNPQITKNYASGNISYMFELVFKGARFSSYLLLLLSLPVFINTGYILNLWLKDVPEQTEIFVKLFLLLAISDSISNPLTTAMSATGKIKVYQLVVGGGIMLNLPITYIFFRLGMSPAISVVVAIGLSQLCLFLRLLLFKHRFGLSIKDFMLRVYFNIVLVGIISSIIPFWTLYYFSDSFLGFVVLCLVSFFSTILAIYFVGCSSSERDYIHDYTVSCWNKLHNISL